MTEYFDSIDQRAAAIFRSKHSLHIKTQMLNQVEEDLVKQVSICTAIPGFPGDLAKWVDQAVLDYSTILPVNAVQRNYDTLGDYYSALGNLSATMHTIFHTLSQRGYENFSDDPRLPLRRLYAQAEERREKEVDRRREEEQTVP